MKGVVILAVILALLGAGIWWGILKETMSDPGAWLLVAMGDPQAKTIDMVVSVEIGMTLRARPRLDQHANPMWDEWAAAHFELRDAGGKVLPFTRIAHCLFVEEEKAKNVPEFYLRYVLQKGQQYTLDQIPSQAKKTRYRYSFTAPSEPMAPQRVQLLAATAGK